MIEDIAVRFERTPWWQYRWLDQAHRSRVYSPPPWLPGCRAAFRVFLRQSRWPKLVLALRAITSHDEDVQDRGEHLFTSLLAAWNHSFTRPTQPQIEELTKLGPMVEAHLTTSAHRDLQDLLPHARPTPHR